MKNRTTNVSAMYHGTERKVTQPMLDSKRAQSSPARLEELKAL